MASPGSILTSNISFVRVLFFYGGEHSQLDAERQAFKYRALHTNKLMSFFLAKKEYILRVDAVLCAFISRNKTYFAMSKWEQTHLPAWVWIYFILADNSAWGHRFVVYAHMPFGANKFCWFGCVCVCVCTGLVCLDVTSVGDGNKTNA